MHEGGAVGARLIAYECVAAAHQPSLVYPDKLTVYQGAWAYCAFDARAAGHEWRETGGVELAALVRNYGLHLLQAGTARADSVAKR